MLLVAAWVLSTRTATAMGEVAGVTRSTSRAAPSFTNHRVADAEAEIALRQGEENRDRLDLRDAHNSVGVRCANNVSGVDLSNAEPAVDRRRDGRVIENGPRIVDGGLIGPHLRLELRDHGASPLGLLLDPALDAASRS